MTDNGAMETFVPVLTITNMGAAFDMLAALTLLVDKRCAEHIADIKSKGYNPDAPTSLLLFHSACTLHSLVIAEIDRLQGAPVND